MVHVEFDIKLSRVDKFIALIFILLSLCLQKQRIKEAMNYKEIKNGNIGGFGWKRKESGWKGKEGEIYLLIVLLSKSEFKLN